MDRHDDAVTCDCGFVMTPQVCRSGAGYYIGLWCSNCGPYDRLSRYFASEQEAQAALDAC